MQHAMQHQDLDFLADRVPVLGGLAPGMLERNRNVAEEPKGLPGGKRQHIRSAVIFTKIAVEPPQLRISRDQASEGTSACNFGLQALRESARLPPRKASRK